MSTTTVNLSDISNQWRIARRLYPFYSALARQFELAAPCRELESPINRSEPEFLAAAKAWLDHIDEKMQAWQLRQLLQTTQLGTEETLRTLINRQMSLPSRSVQVRDRVDYLFVQYFIHCDPHHGHKFVLNYGEIMDVLHPILGDLPIHFSQEIEEETDRLVYDLKNCADLGELLEQRILERVRKLKDDVGTAYFIPNNIVSFVNLNYLVRIGFFRLMHAELHSIRFALHALEGRGVVEIDCARAGLSAHETPASLRQICHEWKKPFRAAYSAGNNFKQLIDIRTAVEFVVLHMPEPGAKNTPGYMCRLEAPKPATDLPATGTQAATAAPVIEEADAPTAAAPLQSNNAPAEEAANGDSGPKKFKVASAADLKSAFANSVTKPLAQPTASSASEAAAPAALALAEEAPATPAPAKTVSAAPKTATAAAPAKIASPAPAKKAAAPEGIPADIESCLERIAVELLSVEKRAASVTHVTVQGSRLLLASWEVAAFVRGGDDVSDALQRAVAARAILNLSLDTRKRGVEIDLSHAIGLAHEEAAAIQERVAEAKEQKNIDGAVSLAATAKRLLGLIDEAEKAGSQAPGDQS